MEHYLLENIYNYAMTQASSSRSSSPSVSPISTAHSDHILNFHERDDFAIYMYVCVLGERTNERRDGEKRGVRGTEERSAYIPIIENAGEEIGKKEGENGNSLRSVMGKV